MKKLKSLFNRKGKKTEEAANNQPTVAEEPVAQQNGGLEVPTKSEENGIGDAHDEIPSIDTEAKSDHPEDETSATDFEHVVARSDAVGSQ